MTEKETLERKIEHSKAIVARVQRWEWQRNQTALGRLIQVATSGAPLDSHVRN